MGKGGDAERARWESVKSSQVDLAGVTVTVAIARSPHPLTPEEVKSLTARAPPTLVLAALSRVVDPCEAALAYLYALEPSDTPLARIKDRHIRFLAILTRAKQAREAIQAAGEPDTVVAASENPEDLERLLGAPKPEEARCRPETLSSVTEFFLALLSR